MLDRFNRSDGKPPVNVANGNQYDIPFGEYQGGTFNGVRDRLRYVRTWVPEAIGSRPC